MKLSIAIITMNRCEQLVEALESCAICALPAEVEFAILDNASTDNTKQAVEGFKNKYPQYDVKYYYFSENLGVGGGRSKIFELCKGEFVYFLDDDAVIDSKCRDSFFIDSIAFMEKHEKVASLTTDICEEKLEINRTDKQTNQQIDGLPLRFMYLGGSHFLKRNCFDTPLYFDIKYGSEEYLPSIRAIDKGYIHVYDENIRIIHKPKINKWVDGSDYMRDVLIRGTAVVYATKKILYPIFFHPILYIGYKKRCSKYLKKYEGSQKLADKMVKEIVDKYKIKKVRFSTVIKMYKLFGMTVF